MPERKAKFYKVLERRLGESGLSLADVCDFENAVEKRILDEYGAIFLTVAKPPPACMFASEKEVKAFQKAAGIGRAEMAGAKIELQPLALEKLLAARDAARQKGLDVSPRGGEEAARRGYADTLRLWKSRFEPACAHWLEKGRLSDEKIARLKKLSIKKQVKEVLEIEKEGIFFNTFFNNSILYSVAAPGTSQHLSMLAFDAAEFNDPRIREILARFGWFRTVQNDAPHFTFLGLRKSELKKLGLKEIETKDGEFWIPAL